MKNSADGTSVEARTGFLVYRTARRMKRALDSELNEHGVSSSQYTVLNALMENEGFSLSEVGRRVALDKPAVTGLVDRLEKSGLVERRRTSADRRVIQLFLTERGRELAGETEQVGVRVDEELVSVLSESELGHLRQMLNRIWESADNK